MRAVGEIATNTCIRVGETTLAKTSPGFTGTATNRVPLACGGGHCGWRYGHRGSPLRGALFPPGQYQDRPARAALVCL